MSSKGWLLCLACLLLLELKLEAATIPVEECQALLLTHLERTDDAFLPWSTLPDELDRRESAVVLVRVPLSAEVVTPLARLGLPMNIRVDMPPEFTLVSGGDLTSVMRGTSAELLKASRELASRFPDLEYQILGGPVRTRAFSLPWPERGFEVRTSGGAGALREYLDGRPNARYLLFDVTSQRLLMIFPASDFDGVSEEWLRQLGVNSLVLDPNVDVAMSLRQSPGAAGGNYIAWGNWRVLSLESYRRFKRAEGQIINLTEPATVELSRRLAEALDLCPPEEGVCEVPAPALEPAAAGVTETAPEVAGVREGEISDAYLRDLSNGRFRRMLRILAAQGGSLNDRDRLQDNAVQMMRQRLKSNKALRDFQVEIRTFGFGSRDGWQLARVRSGQPGRYLAMERFIALWRKIANLLIPMEGAADAPLTPERLDGVLAFLESDEEARPQPAEMASTAVATEERPAPARGRKTLPRLFTPEATYAMIEFLRSTLVTGSISQPNGMRIAFINLVRPLKNPSAEKAEYKKGIDAIGFRPYDYNAIMSHAGRASESRLNEAWQLLRRLIQDPEIEVAVTTESIASTAKLYREKAASFRAPAPSAAANP